MKRELGIARCGLACCLCSENSTCSGCDSGECPDKDWCENRKCSIEKGLGRSMAWNSFWTALSGMRKKVLYTIEVE